MVNLEKIIEFIDKTPILSEIKHITYTGLDKELIELFRPITKKYDEKANGDNKKNLKYIIGGFTLPFMEKSKQHKVSNYLLDGIISIYLKGLIIIDPMATQRHFFSNQFNSLFAKHLKKDHTGVVEKNNVKIIDNDYVFYTNEFSTMTRLPSLYYGSYKLIEGVSKAIETQSLNQEIASGLAWLYTGFSSYLIQSNDNPPKSKYKSPLLSKLPKINIITPTRTKIKN